MRSAGFRPAACQARSNSACVVGNVETLLDVEGVAEVFMPRMAFAGPEAKQRIAVRFGQLIVWRFVFSLLFACFEDDGAIDGAGAERGFDGLAVWSANVDGGSDLATGA